MIDELIDSDFIRDDGKHQLERLGFLMVKKNDSRIWAGSSNMYVETRTFQKKNDPVGNWNVEVEVRKDTTGQAFFERIIGRIFLPSNFKNKKGSLKTKNEFYLFQKPEDNIEKYYLFEPKIIGSAVLLKLLFELRENGVEIKIENGIVDFEFNIEDFESHTYETIIEILSLVPNW